MRVRKSIIALFLMGYFAIFFLVNSFNLIYSVVIAVSNMSLGAPFHLTWGANFVRLFADPLVWNGMTVVLSVLAVQMPIMTILALIIALLVSSPLMRGRTIFQTIFIAPIMTSLVASALIWDPLLDFRYGLVNEFLKTFGLPNYPWLLNPTLALFSIFAVITWRWTGYNMLIFTAGLQGIPQQLYDAAGLEANRFQIVRHITLPLLKPALIFSVVFSVIGSLQTFTEPYVLTQGGPYFATNTIGMWIYNIAFFQGEFGYAAAISWFLAVIIILASVPFLRSIGFFSRGE